MGKMKSLKRNVLEFNSKTNTCYTKIVLVYLKTKNNYKICKVWIVVKIRKVAISLLLIILLITSRPSRTEAITPMPIYQTTVINRVEVKLFQEPVRLTTSKPDRIVLSPEDTKPTIILPRLPGSKSKTEGTLEQVRGRDGDGGLNMMKDPIVKFVFMMFFILQKAGVESFTIKSTPSRLPSPSPCITRGINGKLEPGRPMPNGRKGGPYYGGYQSSSSKMAMSQENIFESMPRKVVSKMELHPGLCRKFNDISNQQILREFPRMEKN
jgi:hypothetical protein